MDKLDKYEKEILESYENDKWISVENLEQRKQEIAQYAKNTFSKNKRINIRLSERDFRDIKSK
jgi:predicted DNA binding CopG/RHH family protein